MTFQEYDEEKIWRRLNKKLDLDKFKKAKTEKQRRKLFRDALRKDKSAKNILKMKRGNQKKIFEFAVAQSALEDGKDLKKSIKRFAPKKRRRISAFKGRIKKLSATESLFKKAESKGIQVRGVKEKVSVLGRPTTEIVKLKEVTISKQFKFGNRIVRGLYKKGVRGVIALEEV